MCIRDRGDTDSGPTDNVQKVNDSSRVSEHVHSDYVVEENQIIIIDNGSEDNSLNLAKKFKSQFENKVEVDILECLEHYLEIVGKQV